MDTPDKAAGLAHAEVADAVNKEWLLASARSSQLSTELHKHQDHFESAQMKFYGTGQKYTSNTCTMNGHLYDNISYADTPLLQSLTLNKPTSVVLDGDEHCDRTYSNSGRPKRGFCLDKFRLVLASFVLLGITLANYSRNALSLAAVGMLASNALNRELVALASNLNSSATNQVISQALDGSCPIPISAIRTSTSSNFQLSQPQASPTQASGEFARASLESEFRASIEARVASGELIDWTPGELGLISAAGSVGNLLIAIPLTRLGEIHGPKWIIFAASLGATLQAALMPLVASCHLMLVLTFQLVFNGLTYGADCVAYTLFAHWLTPTEMAFFVSCLIICYQLGSMISSFVTAGILTHGLAWSWCFYTPAILCAIWTLIWALIGASEPLCSRLISKRERAHLSRCSKIAQSLKVDLEEEGTRGSAPPTGSRKHASVAWTKLARDPNIWAIIAVKFTLRWYFSTYLSLMPTYLSSIGHMSVATIGTMSVIQSCVGLFAGVLMGYLTRSLVTTTRLLNLSIATTRKCFQSIVNFGLALSLIIFIAYDCDQWVAMVSLTLGTLCISFYVAAALQIPLDLSATHCGLITSITNTLALGQALGAPLSGLILDGGPKERSRWRLVWAVAIVMNILSGLVFILLVDSKPRDYSKTTSTVRATGRNADEETGSTCLE